MAASLPRDMGRLAQKNVLLQQCCVFGQLSEDEFFVSCDAAQKGVRIRNGSTYDTLVMLKHFPANDSVPKNSRAEI